MRKVALITGGNRGIGYEVSKQLAGKGFRVVLTARDPKKGKEALEKLKEAIPDGDIGFHLLDVKNQNDIQAIQQFVEKEIGKLDLLINNAGVFIDSADSTRVTPEAMRETLEVNLLGVLFLTQALLPLLKKSEDGRIINVSSSMGALHDMGKGSTAYRISKTALNGLTATMAADLSNSVKVFAVCPGWTKTEMGGEDAPRGAEKEAETILWLSTTPEAKSGKFYRDGQEIDW